MIHVRVSGYDLIAKPIHSITSGTVGRMVDFEFSPEWENLVKTAVFKGSGEARDVALLASGTCTIPLDVLEEHGGDLLIGVYGRSTDGSVVMPTVWGRIEYIREGTKLSEADPSEPEPDWTAQVQAMAQAALAKAQAVEEAAERGDFDGEDGAYPEGGKIGDIMVKTSAARSGVSWVTPASHAEEDNTLPITAAGVYTEIGNINALLATI